MTTGADVGDLLRTLAPQVTGALVRRYGHFDTAEDAVAARWRAGRPARVDDPGRLEADDRHAARRAVPSAA